MKRHDDKVSFWLPLISMWDYSKYCLKLPPECRHDVLKSSQACSNASAVIFLKGETWILAVTSACPLRPSLCCHTPKDCWGDSSCDPKGRVDVCSPWRWGQIHASCWGCSQELAGCGLHCRSFQWEWWFLQTNGCVSVSHPEAPRTCWSGGPHWQWCQPLENHTGHCICRSSSRGPIQDGWALQQGRLHLGVSLQAPVT